MKKRNKLGKGWKDKAKQYAGQCWHVPEFRYFCIEQATPNRIATIAAHSVRSDLNYWYREALEHPKSKKAMQKLYEFSKELGSIGLYLLTNTETKE